MPGVQPVLRVVPVELAETQLSDRTLQHMVVAVEPEALFLLLLPVAVEVGASAVLARQDLPRVDQEVFQLRLPTALVARA